MRRVDRQIESSGVGRDGRAVEVNRAGLHAVGAGCEIDDECIGDDNVAAAGEVQSRRRCGAVVGQLYAAVERRRARRGRGGDDVERVEEAGGAGVVDRTKRDVAASGGGAGVEIEIDVVAVGEDGRAREVDRATGGNTDTCLIGVDDNVGTDFHIAGQRHTGSGRANVGADVVVEADFTGATG